MIFANLFFIYLFLPLNIILYFISKNKTYRNVVLVSFSMFFYAWGEPVWICILLLTTLLDYALGLFIANHRTDIKGKTALAAAVVLNLAVLIAFKYTGFIYENINAIFNAGLTAPAVSMPIGISFYTFQTMSYVVDVYRGEVGAQRNPLKFLMYVSMYHQLVAGPIVRYSHIAYEIENRTTNTYEISKGITRFIIGLAKKVIIANAAGALLAPYLDGDLSALSVGGAWFGIIMFTLQIYFDFSGYSDMAIGLGLIFGFHYRENFNYPYISASVTDFWRRWHISLSSFFRDYIYIPLGGNRRHRIFNLIVVWFLTGLWHGASWNFIIWGLYFCALLIAEKTVLLKALDKAPKFVGRIYTMTAVVIGWAIFYFTDLTRLGAFFKAAFGFNGVGLSDVALSITVSDNILWIIISIAAALPVVPFVKAKLEEKTRNYERLYLVCDSVQVVINTALLALCTVLLVGQSYNPFLYYRF